MHPTSTACFVILLACAVKSRRPRAASPQERRAKPGLNLPRAEDLVGALVPSRWKWPLYPEQRPPPLGEWRRGQKAGEWVWRGDRRGLEQGKDNRWNPYLNKKPTGLAKKPNVPVYKFLGPKFQKQKRPSVKLRLAPVVDLRPKSIDRIDILRPQVTPLTEVTRNFAPSLGSLKAIQVVPSRVKNKQREKVVDDKLAADKSVAVKKEEEREVDGIKIYMFRGDEGIGGYKAPYGFHQNLVLPDPDSRKTVQWSKAELKSEKVQKPTTTPLTPKTTPQPYYNSPRATLPDIAPPFPTVHTTTSPDQHRHPIVIIAQSNVAQN